MEKILFEVSNPILTLSGKLETIKRKMHKHRRMLEEYVETNKKEFKRITKDFDNCCREIHQILKDYKIISELAHIVADDRETLEKKLKGIQLLNRYPLTPAPLSTFFHKPSKFILTLLRSQ